MSLGPSFIKLGQFLATRPDIISKDYAQDLSQLHDSLPPFSQEVAQAQLDDFFQKPVFESLGKAHAAASIAQVHKARGRDGRFYAVKILRPHIEKRFRKDMDSLLWLAQKMEAHSPAWQRLKPMDALKNLEQITLREMDLRLEAASMAQMAQNCKNSPIVHIPLCDWRHSGQRILTTEWIEGIKIDHINALKAKKHDLPQLAKNLLEIFLTCALYDGFFHADFHPGNLFVRSDGVIVPVDFGIMGNLANHDRRAMAWILHGLISGNYHLAAKWHIYAGYVPADTPEADFALALRAIGEPILDKTAKDISMGELLLQLFETAQGFDMQTQPQLLLLQKTMMATEGIARHLDPDLNIWQIAKPIIAGWMKQEYAPQRVIEDFAEQSLDLWFKAHHWLNHKTASMDDKMGDDKMRDDKTRPILAKKQSQKGVMMIIGLVFFALGVAWAENIQSFINSIR